MRIEIDGLLFDGGHYDAEGDVLYLSRGTSHWAVDGALTCEGHLIRYDADGSVVGVTILNVKWLLDRDGYLKITMPHEIRLQPDELMGTLAAA